MVSVIARRWTALAEGSEQADAYAAHFEGAVRPALESSKGFLGATVERVTVDGAVEIVVVTRWESMDAIRGFAGDQTDLAVVEPQASPLTSEAEPSHSPILRSQDGGVSEAPAFLQARPEPRPAAASEDGEAVPRPRKRRAPRSFEATGGEESTPKAAEDA